MRRAMPYSYEPHHFEDFAVGQKFETIGRTVTETDFVNQASLSGDWGEYHTNVEYASENLFGERIAQAPLTFSISLGLMANAGFLARTAAGLAEMAETNYPRVVSIGDTLSAGITVTDTADVSREDAGIIKLEMVTSNQNEDVVFETTLTVFVLRASNGVK